MEILFFEKVRGIISGIISASIKDSLPYSHCGIHAKEKQQWKVIHSVARELSNIDGVQQCSLDDFITYSDDSCFIVLRCRIDNVDFLIASMADSSAFF
ncbi:MAG: Permuted papain-like amidase enzyme, YaeF/YiiX, family [Bacteroidetes bacterium]|nr:Permuted papain-like amidase enzyme, YaeF/YiiX, family [Bacteroidota bacterium]